MTSIARFKDRVFGLRDIRIEAGNGESFRKGEGKEKKNKRGVESEWDFLSSGFRAKRSDNRRDYGHL